MLKRAFNIFFTTVALLLVICLTTFASAANDPIYEPLMGTKSLSEFRGMLLHESNRYSVMALTAEEIDYLSVHVCMLYDAIDNPTDDDTYYKEEMLETLSILPNGPMELYGQPTTYANLQGEVNGGSYETGTTVHYLTGNVTLKSQFKVSKGATLKIINSSKNPYTITRGFDSANLGTFFCDNSGVAQASYLYIQGNANGGTITISNGTYTPNTATVEALGFVQMDYVIFSGNANGSNANNLGYTAGAVTISQPVGESQTFNNCKFQNCTGRLGAVSIQYSSDIPNVSFNNCTFEGNKATTSTGTNKGGYGGAIGVVASGRVTVNINGCTFRNNSAASHGGAIGVETTNCTINLTGNNSFSGNSSGTHGGAISLVGANASLVISNNSNSFSENHSGTYGGSISMTGSNSGLTVSGSNSWTSNYSGTHGGAIYIENSKAISLSGATFTTNRTNGVNSGGGAIYWNSKGTISSCTFDGNTSKVTQEGSTASHGGAISVFPKADSTIEHCVIKNCESGNGSAIYFSGSAGKTLTLKNSLIEKCARGATQGGDGGTIRTVGACTNSLVVENTVIRNNTHTRGGAIYWNGFGGKLTIKNSQLLNNEVTVGGGAIYMESENLEITGDSGTVTAEYTGTTAPGTLVGTRIGGNSVTYAFNAKDAYGMGGGIFISNYGGGNYQVNSSQTTIDLNSNVIIYNNTAARGAGIAFNLAASTTFSSGRNFVVNINSGAKIQGNTSNGYGGGIYMNSVGPYVPVVNLKGGSIVSNRSYANGGGVCIMAGTFNMTSGTVGGSANAENLADNGLTGEDSAGNGGAFYVAHSNYDNQGLDGTVNSGTLMMSGGTISYNRANTSGGAICVNGSGVVNISSSATLCNNSANNGGAINLDGGTATMSGGTISSNMAVSKGAGVRVAGGTFDMTGGTIGSGNDVGNIGGGLCVTGGKCNIGVKNCSGHTHPQITGNVAGFAAEDGHARGAGIAVQGGEVNMYCGTVDGNTTYGYAAGHAATYYQSSGTFNYCGGYLGVGMFVLGGAFNTRNSGNTANVTKYTITYDIHTKRDSGTWGDPLKDPDEYFDTADWQRCVKQILRTNTLTLPGQGQMNNERYSGSGQNGIFKLMGWANSAANANDAVYTNQAVGDTITLSGDKTLYGVWYRGTTGTITYNYNGNGQSTGTATYTVTTSSSSFTLPQPTRTGYTFAGWKVTSNSGGNWVKDHLYVKGEAAQLKGLYGNVTLTAQWTANQYKVSFNKNASDATLATSSKNVTYDSTYGTLPTPTRDGYTFNGWYTTAGGGTKVTSTTKVAITAAQTLYAHWTPNTNTKYTVKHWKQKLGAASTQNSTNYALADTDNLTGTTASTVTPSRKSYAGFTAPSGTQITIAADGSTVLNYYYTRNSYTVTLNKGTGISSVTGAGTFQYEQPVTINAGVSTGYAWKNWTGYSTQESQSCTFNMPASNVDYTANASAINYTITYVLAGGSVNGTNPGSYTIESNDIKLNNPTRDGYTFAGWTGTGINGASTSVTIAKGSTGNRTYTATWTPINYSITYNLNGGSVTGSNAVSYNIESDDFTLINPTRTGYIFDGWSGTGINGKSTSVEIAEGSIGNRSYTANWTPITYTVAFNANYGTGTMATMSFTYDQAQNLTANAFSKTGYTFAGWATSANGSTAYSDGQSVSNLTTTDGATVTLYAKWNANGYTVIFNANGGTGTMANQSFTYDAAKNLTANAFSKIGYTFAGWATSANGEVVYGNSAEVLNLASANGAEVNLYAKWTPITYTIRFNGNGATGEMADLSVAYDQTVNLTALGFSKSGYKFQGWRGSDGKNYSDGASVTNLTAVHGAVITMTAQWELATTNFAIDVEGLAAGQSAVIEITGTRADGDAFKKLTFVVIGNGTTKLAGLPVGNYTIIVNGRWTWRYSSNPANADSATTSGVTISFAANGNVKWLNAYGQSIK